MDGTSCGYQGLDFCANGRCQVRRPKRQNVCAEGGLWGPGAAASTGESSARRVETHGRRPDSTVNLTESDLLCIMSGLV